MKKLNQIKSVARHASAALLAVLIMFSARHAEAQTDNVGIGTTTPDNSSILDLTSTSRGFLTPRMTVVQRNSITTPVIGLMIYQTNDTPGFYYYNGTSWVKISDTIAGVITGGGTAGQLSFWTSTTAISGNDDMFWDNVNNRLGIGTTTPSTLLDVEGIALLGSPASPPADDDINNSQWTLWLDEPNDEFELRAKKSDGSIIAQTVGDVSPGGNTGELQFNNNGAFGSSSNLFWDISNSNLGIGAGTTPNADLDVEGSVLLGAPNSSPSEGIFANSQWTLWLDETTDQFQLKAKKSGGTFMNQIVGGPPGGSDGHMQYNDAGALGANANFVWDDANGRLSVGNAAPVDRVDLRDASGNGGIRVANSVITQPGVIRWTGTDFEGYTGSLWASFTSSGGGGDGGGDVWANNGSNGRVAIFNSSTTITGTDAFYWDLNAERLGIGAGTTPSADLDVEGIVILGAPNAAPSDATFDVSQWTLWIDETEDRFNLKAKQSDGTIMSHRIGDVTAAGNSGEIQFNEAGTLGASSNLVWHNTSTSLGIAAGATPSANLDVEGTVILGAPSSAPADADFDNSQWSLWLNETSDKFQLKAKKTDGTIITSSLATAAGNDGEIQYNAGGSFAASTNYIWDNTNIRLGIGAGAPTSTIDAVGGSALLPAPNSAPTDADLDNSQWTLWLDEATDEFELKAKNSSGTIISQTIGLAAGNAGEVQFNDGSGVFAASSDFVWDITNSRLGIGTNTPKVDLDVEGRAVLGAPNTATGNDDLANSQWSFWIDETSSDFKIKAKNSTGTILSKTIAEAYAMSYRTTETSTAANTYDGVPWESDVVLENGYYSRSSDVITVAKSGLYRISFALSIRAGSANQNVVEVWARNGSVNLPGGYATTFIENDNNDDDRSTASNSFLADLAADATIKIYASSPSGRVFYILPNSQITIERLRN